jgi:TFIIB zinc-binding
MNYMVIVSSNKVLVNKSKDDNDNGSSTLETSTVCPLCKTEIAIITDPKSGEIICSRCGMVVSDKMLERLPEWN